MNEREILDQLVAEEKITEKDITEIEDRILTEEKTIIIDSLHARSCKLNHDIGECRWYEEEQLRQTWARPYHSAWVDLFNSFLTSTKLIKFIPEAVTEESSSGPDDSPLPG